MKYVIIGNSAAAVGAIEGIRTIDREGDITLIASEPHHTYGRPLISYLLMGKTDRERMKYRPNSFYSDNGVTPLLGRTAEKIEDGCVVMDGGDRVPYDRLLIATGSRPFVPPMDGLDRVEKKFSFMTLDDALALEQELAPDKKILIIGAGLIGLKCAEGISGRVGSIAVVDLADRVLPSILDERGSAIVQEHLEQKGISFILNDSVASFGQNSAVLKSGKAPIDFDILVVAVGVRPNVELAQQAGISVGRGITVNAKSETSMAGVYAAGDCTECTDMLSGDKKILALLPNAYMQGETAGINMAGGNASFEKAIPMNAMGVLGLHMVTAGSYDGEIYTEDKGDGSYKLLATRGDRLVGFIIIGNVERAGIYTSLIREKTPLSSLDFDLIKTKPQLMAFSRRDRAHKLSEPG